MAQILILPVIEEEAKHIGKVEVPVVTVSDIPADISVGDKIKPKITVKRADGTTPIEGVSIDYFVNDILGLFPLGTRVLTNADGEASASEFYYVGRPDANQTVTFLVIVRPKRIAA